MIKLIITLGMLNGMFNNPTKKETINIIEYNTTVDNIQDMKEWMQEDINAGIINAEQGAIYLEWLEDTEDLLLYRLIEKY